MREKTDRDASVDRLLAGAMKARAEAATQRPCLDADTLAAWADEALDARERAGAEAHAADCVRCQALLAAMVRTLPLAAAAKSPWRLPALGWLVPFTVAATALVIWVAVPSREPAKISDGGAEAVDQSAPARVPAPVAAPLADARTKASSAVERPREVAGQQNVAAPVAIPPPVPAVASAFDDLRERREVASLEKQAPPAEAAGASAVGGAAGGIVGSPGPARALAFASAPERIIVSSNPSTRFRVLRGGGVQRSADAGATWRTEVTGTTETLTAGSSPSPSVCWLVGPAGMVLLSTDGRSWRRLAFPEAFDLRSVDATDEESATVTTADGRAFVTTDAGRTWSRAPDL